MWQAWPVRVSMSWRSCRAGPWVAWTSCRRTRVRGAGVGDGVEDGEGVGVGVLTGGATPQARVVQERAARMARFTPP